MAQLTLTLLGGFQARLDTGPPLALSTRKIQAFLAYLALPAGRAHSRDKLAALLWGDQSQEQARHSLRQAIFSLRRAVDPVRPACVCVEGATIALNAEAVTVDAMSFERLLAERTPLALGQAVALYRGDLLGGLTRQEPPFEEWLMGERERLRELAIEAHAALLAAQRAAGDVEAALQTGLRLFALDPLQEPLHRTLMRLYAQLGRRGSALHQYQLCVSALQRELGVEPEQETKQLYQEILRQRPSSRAKVLDPPWPRSQRGAVGMHPDLPGKDAPLVGRESELARLRQVLDAATRSEGQFVAIFGEAGVGKTRLLGAAAADASSKGARRLLGRCYESAQILPFGPWVDACRAGGVLGDGTLHTLDPVWRAELARLFPEIDTTGLPLPSDSDLRLFESMVHLVEQLAARQLTVLMLEDMHWSDDMSWRLLAFLTRRIPSWPLLLVASCREEELGEATAAQHTLEELSRHPWVTRVTLAPLPRADTIDLIRAIARMGSDDEALTRLAEPVWAVSEGNPFVVVETVRAFQDGVIPSTWTGLPVAERVRAMIAARLGRLREPAQQLAAMASVIGREFTFPLLQRASGLDEASAAEGVEELVRRRVLHGVGERFAFVHHRLQAVMYDRLLLPRRKLFHRRVGEALEAISSGDPRRDPLALGRHFFEGEVWAKAVEYLRRSGIGAVARSAYREAVASFEQALAALEHLPQGHEQIQMATDLHLSMREALNPLGELDAIFKHLHRAEALAFALGDQRRLADVLCNSAKYFQQVGDHRQSLERAERALAIAEALGDFGLRVVANNYLAQATWHLGDAGKAKDLFTRFADSFGRDRVRNRFGMTGYPALSYRILLGACHAELGEFPEAIDRGEQGLGLAEEFGQPYSLLIAYLWLGRIYLLRGVLPVAVRLLERGVEIAERRHLGGWGRDAPGAALGYGLALSGRVPKPSRCSKARWRAPRQRGTSGACRCS
jgi:DNA-binding SARP family transcriptional activator